MMDEKQILGKSDGVTEKMSSKNDTDEPKKKKSKKGASRGEASFARQSGASRRE